jgi:outer membrane receptor protein involved in Fe transport
MQNSVSVSVRGFLVFLTSFALSSVVNAQSDRESGLVLEEVTVTAQKRQQNINDIGMSITAFTGEALDKLKIVDTADLAFIVPGMTFAESPFSTPIYTLRGVGFNEDAIQATATVTVYNDQIPTAFPIMTKGLMMDIERVEVLKGPQGTLYGRNTTGGAINYIANKPTEEFEAGVTVGYGRFNTFEGGGFVSGSLGDHVGARFAFKTIQSSEGWQESITRDEDLGEMDKISARLLVDIEASENVDILLAANWWQDKSDTPAPQFLQPAYQFPNPWVIELLDGPIDPRIGNQLIGDNNRDADWTRGTKPRMDQHSEAISMTINWQINDQVELTSLSSFSSFSSNDYYNTGGHNGIPADRPIAGDPFGGLFGTAQTLMPTQAIAGGYTFGDIIDISSWTNDGDIDAFSQELRLSGGTEKLNWVVGGYYSSDTVKMRTIQDPFSTNSNLPVWALGEGAVGALEAFGVLAPGTPLNYVIGTQGADNQTRQDADTWAIFAHTEWQLGDAWNLTAGLRYTKDNKDFEGCTKDIYGDTAELVNAFSVLFGGFMPNIQKGECVTVDVDSIAAGSPQAKLVESSLDEDSTSGKLALDYRFNDDVLGYVSYSRGFKSGSYPTLNANTSNQYEPVTQEKIDAWEIGFKSTLGGGAAQLNGAVFYYDYKDKQLLTRVPTFFGALTALANVPKSKVKGAELDLQWQPAEGLYISLNGTYVDSEIKEFIGYNQFGQQGDFAGSEFPLTPKFQATGLINYEWNAGENLVPFVGADVSYSSGFNTDYDSEDLPMDPVFRIDSATLLGLRAGIRSGDGAWSVFAWGRNVTNEFNPSNVKKYTDGVLRYNGMPATYGVTFSYNWF